MIELIREYPYLYETHLHTSPSSACAANTGAEMARACKKAGYTGIFVTDHNWGGNTGLDRNQSWSQWVECFCQGYESASEEGRRIGLDVFFAWEAGYRGTEFLVYGLSKEWLLSHPEIRQASVEEQYRLVREGGGMVIHAHPFREEHYIPEIRLYPEWVDAVEGINATHSNKKSKAHCNKAFDDRAAAYANENQLPMTAGSDIHTTNLFGGGMAFRHKLETPADFIRAVTETRDYLLTNGEKWFDRYGKALEG